MRTIVVTLIILVYAGIIKAGNTYTQQPLLQKLSAVNAEWPKQPEANELTTTTTITGNASFNQWIATHLQLVEQTLRNRSTPSLTTAQKQNRTHLLDELNGYWKAGVFPVNDYLPYKNPVFIDRKGTHCAVGYLMMQSGHDDLAQRIDRNEKFAYVHEIKTAGVAQWADEHGFTVDELAWIQPGYPPATQTFDMDSGLNGTVNTIAPDLIGQTIYVGGSFSHTTGGTACNNIAAWISGFAGYDWVPVGTGLNGTVHTLLLQNNKLYAGGEFTMAGNVAVNHVAVYDIAQGQWQAIGSLDSTVYALAFYNGNLYAAGKFSGFLAKWNGSQWSDITSGFLYGEGARTLEVYDNKLVVGGNFELATGALRKHVAVWDGTYMSSLDMGTLTPVNDLVVHNNILIAACDIVSGTDTCAIAAFENGNWVVKLKGANNVMDYFNGTAIKSLLSDNGHLLAAGNFDCGSGMTIGSDLIELSNTPAGWGDTTQYMAEPLIFTDSAINAIAVYNNTLYFGGGFAYSSGKETNHIAYISLVSTSVNDLPAANVTVQVFPNPATGNVTLNCNGSTMLQAELTDATGRRVLSEKLNTASTGLQLNNLSPGVYTLRVQTQNGWGTTRLIKQ